jgi:5-(carboxyamino)imidazole ribonucleotide mutase
VNNQPKVAVVMGSDSDFPLMKQCVSQLKALGIEPEVRVISAHRTPEAAEKFARNAEADGIEAIIAAAGMAAHLAGVLAAYTVLPVIAVPIKSGSLGGLDALFSTAQMPKGVPVATVAIDGARNAAILAAQILGGGRPEIREKLRQMKERMKDEVAEKNLAIKQEVEGL